MQNLDDKKTRRRCATIERSSDFSQVYKTQYLNLLGSMQILPQSSVHAQISFALHALSFSHVEPKQWFLKTFDTSLAGQLLTRPSRDLSRL